MSDDLVKRLRYGLIEYPKRWSGDTHSDMGGSVDYDKTYALLDEAANRIEALEAKLAQKDGELGLLRAHIHRLGYAGSQFEALLLPRGVEGPDYRHLHTETARKWRKAHDKAIVAALKGLDYQEDNRNEYFGQHHD